MGRGIGKYSTAAAIEDPIIPSVKVDYTQLLIDGKFVDAASGELSVLSLAWMGLNVTFLKVWAM